MNAPNLVAREPSIHTAPARPDPSFGGFQDLEVVQAARTGACVLFTGRANAKGLALLIHSLSGWRWGPFVSIDCGASDAVLERQLFDVIAPDAEVDPGSEPTPRLAQDGTIFLYEVGKLNCHMQARLADALAAGTASDPRRRPRKRVMASSSVSLLDRVASGTFDDRLFYRLNAIHFSALSGGVPDGPQS